MFHSFPHCDALTCKLLFWPKHPVLGPFQSIIIKSVWAFPVWTLIGVGIIFKCFFILTFERNYVYGILFVLLIPSSSSPSSLPVFSSPKPILLIASTSRWLNCYFLSLWITFEDFVSLPSSSSSISGTPWHFLLTIYWSKPLAVLNSFIYYCVAINLCNRLNDLKVNFLL